MIYWEGLIEKARLITIVPVSFFSHAVESSHSEKIGQLLELDRGEKVENSIKCKELRKKDEKVTKERNFGITAVH